MESRAEEDAARLDGLSDRQLLLAVGLKAGPEALKLIADNPKCDKDDDTPGSIMSLALLESLRDVTPSHEEGLLEALTKRVEATAASSSSTASASAPPQSPPPLPLFVPLSTESEEPPLHMYRPRPVPAQPSQPPVPAQPPSQPPAPAPVGLTPPSTAGDDEGIDQLVGGLRMLSTIRDDVPRATSTFPPRTSLTPTNMRDDEAASPHRSSSSFTQRPRRASVMLGTAAPTELERALEASLHCDFGGLSPLTPSNKSTLRARLTAGLTSSPGADAAAAPADGWWQRQTQRGRAERGSGESSRGGATLSRQEGSCSSQEGSLHSGTSAAASMCEREGRLHIVADLD